MAKLTEVREALADLSSADGFIVLDDRLRLLAKRPPAQVKGAAAYLILLGMADFGVEHSIRPQSPSAAPRELRVGRGAHAQAPPAATSGAVEAIGGSRLAEEARGADGGPAGPRMSIV